jgi:CRP-like cAMP-binding protein
MASPGTAGASVSEHSESTDTHERYRRDKGNHGPKKLFEIDYVGNESWVNSQRNILLSRAAEPHGTDYEALLSARGLHHRNREHFVHDMKESTAVIRNMMKEDKAAKKSGKPSAQLLQPLFTRALAYERLKQNPKAMKDYELVLKIDDKNASAYFNRAGLHAQGGNDDLALIDLNKAIALDPMNMQYRNNKARLLRRKGAYMDAIEQTLIYRAIETQPEYMEQQFATLGDPKVDSTSLPTKVLPKDPLLMVLRKLKKDRKPREMECVVDFIRTLKFFHAFKNDEATLFEIANEVELVELEKDDFLFEEGMLGEHFYMILDGEISIVKCKKNADGDILKTNVLVKLYRGQTFGETALESSGGVRSAGALATQPSHLLNLHVDIYKKIVGEYKQHLRAEVRLVLSSCPAFSEFSDEALDTLAKEAILRNYLSNKEILKDGDSSKYLYIVKQGLVKVIKKLKNPAVKNIKVFTPYSGKVQKSETPGLWVLEKSFTLPVDSAAKSKKKDKKSEFLPSIRGKDDEEEDPRDATDVELQDNETEFTVGVIASGQIFGELAVLNPGEPSPTTVISTTPSEVFLLDGELVLAMGAKYSSKCMNALTEGVTLHNPPTEKLSYFFRAKYVQERQMKDVLTMLKTQK